MTIAMGILSNDGIVMSADTMMSGQVKTSYESKITGYKFHDGKAVFALSGYATFAQSAIQDCEPTLRKGHKLRTHAEIISALKPVLSEAFARQITRPGLSISDFYL